MNILLVRPPRMKQSINLTDIMFCEPIGLEILYTILKEKHRVKIVDLMIEKEDITFFLREDKYDVVGITSLCIDVFNVLNIADKIKNFDPNIITFIGGTQAYFMPEAFFSKSVDYIFKYTDMENLIRVIDNIEAKRVEDVKGVYIRSLDYKCSLPEGRNCYIVPDRSSTKIYRENYSYFGYMPCAIMGTSFGCSNCCKFCLRWRLEGSCEQYKPLDEVIEEILSIKEESIMIYDNDFLHNGSRLREFCNFLKEKGIRKNFICYGSVKGIIKNKVEVEEFSKLGLKAVLVGYESFNDSELMDYNKKINIADNIKAAEILKELKVDCWASFIAHPDWGKSDFRLLRKYIYKLKPENTTISPLTPFYNLPLYKEYEDRLLYKKEDYDIWSFGNVIISPSKLSIREYYLEIFKTIVYVNFRTNRPLHMLRRFGLKNIIRLLIGGIKLSKRYLKLVNGITISKIK